MAQLKRNNIQVNIPKDFKILAVDDENDNLLLIKSYLRNTNIILNTSTNAADAIRYSKNNYYDVILMDLNLPDRNGIDTTRIIREKTRCADSYIIAITASDKNEISFSHLFNDFVGKPLSKNDLYFKLSLSLKP